MAINRLNPDYPDAGTVQLMPSSVAVGSGSSTTNGNGSVTFSGASSVSLNDVFSTTYNNYFITLLIESTSNADVQFRYRVSGADNSNAAYNYAVAGLSAVAGAANLTGSSQTLNKFGSVFAGNKAHFVLNIFQPFITASTLFTSAGSGYTAGGSSTTYTGGGEQYNATSFTGITFYASAGNITGTVSVYGYRN